MHICRNTCISAAKNKFIQSCDKHQKALLIYYHKTIDIRMLFILRFFHKINKVKYYFVAALNTTDWPINWQREGHTK